MLVMVISSDKMLMYSAYFLRLSMTSSSNKVSTSTFLYFLGVRREFFKEESGFVGRSYHNLSGLDVFLSFFIRVDVFLSYQVFLVKVEMRDNTYIAQYLSPSIVQMQHGEPAF